MAIGYYCINSFNGANWITERSINSNTRAQTQVPGWLSQLSVRTLDLSLSHDFMVHEFKRGACLRFSLSFSYSHSLSPSLCPFPTHSHTHTHTHTHSLSLSLSLEIDTKKRERARTKILAILCFYLEDYRIFHLYYFKESGSFKIITNKWETKDISE